MATPVNCLVIGIDYGTTYTGVAFRDLSFDENGQVQEKVITPVLTWPGGRDANNVPSQISYAAAAGGERQWGFDISPNTARIGLTKLQLEYQERLEELKRVLEAVQGMESLDISKIDQGNGLALSYSKDPEAIVADYLSGIREWFMEYLRSIYDTTYLEVTPIDLVVTVPAGWSQKAKDRTLRAFRQAGFDNDNPDFAHLRETIIMSEPEAAALAVVRGLASIDGDGSFRPGDCFILCDAGGGTVDLISYRIKETRPTLVLEEVGYATGGRCGASFIDADFQRWLKSRIGAANYAKLVTRSAESAIGTHTTITPDMQDLMNRFEAVKRQYSGAAYVSSIPLPRILEDIEEDRGKGIMDGDIRINDEDLHLIFNPTVERALELLGSQYAQVRHAGSNVRHIFLSGGFGESPYLQKKVGEFARLRRIQLRITDDPWLSVVLGAVTKGLEQGIHSNARSRCRRHYGLATSQPFSSFRHSEDDAYNDPFDGEKKAAKQMTWLIRKGDTLYADEPKAGSLEICRKFGLAEGRVFRTTVVAYDDDFAPQRQADIHDGGATFFDIVYDLSQVAETSFTQVRASARGLPYFSVNLRIELELKENFQARVRFNGVEISSVTKAYL